MLDGNHGNAAGREVAQLPRQQAMYLRRDTLLEQLAVQAQAFDASVGEYQKKYTWAKRRALGLKALAIIAFAIGALMPVIDSLKSTLFGADPLEIGFVALTVSGLSMGLDRAMMMTANRLGFLQALVELKFLRRSFEIDRVRFEWLATDDHAALSLSDQVFEAMREAEAARVAIVRSETEAWREEYRASVADLKAQIAASTQQTRTALSEKATRQEDEERASATGAARIRLEVGSTVGEIHVTLGNRTRSFEAPVDQVVFPDLPPSLTLLQIRWKSADTWKEREDVLTIKPNEIVDHTAKCDIN